MSIRHRLYLLVLLATLPVLLLTATLINERFDRVRQAELDVNAEIATTGATAFMTHINDLWAAESVVGRAAYTQEYSVDQVSLLMRSLVPEHRGLRVVEWIDDAGRVRASTSSTLVGTTTAPELMARFKAGEIHVLSDLHWDNTLNAWTLCVAHSFFDGGRFTGAIVAHLDSKELARFLPRPPSNRKYVLVDRSGTFVFSSDTVKRSSKPQVLEYPGPGLTALTEHRSVSVDHFRTDHGRVLLGAAEYMDEIGWVSFVVSPAPAVYGPVWQETRQNIGFLIGAALVALGLVIVWSRTITRPLGRLREATAAISAGHLGVRAHVEGNDEVAATSATFDLMAERLQDLEEARERLARVAVHELKNPLATISATAQLLRFRLKGAEHFPDIERCLDRIAREVGRANGGLDDIVAALRVTTQPLRQEPVNLSNVIHEAVAAGRDASAEQQSEVTFVTDDVRTDVWVMGDSHKLEQVMRNLLSNAVKYSEESARVFVSLIPDRGAALLSVADQGIGIAPNELPRVFESFYRSERTPTKDPGGMGLGLYIVKEIVERHLGRIWVDSRLGEGTTFFISLPLIQQTA